MHSVRGERKVKRVVSVKWNWFRILVALVGSVMLVTLLGVYAFACSYVYLAPSLPSTQAMRNVDMQVPLRIYTRSGALIAQIGEQRRIPVTYEQIPDVVKHAFLAAEDERFFEHHGIDYLGVVRAVVVDLVSGDKTQGASTITKQEIFGLYLNVIFFGQRAYGVAAAAETFFGKTLDQLTVAEAATIAGLPHAPPPYNPITTPQRAAGRRAYVLGRMRYLGYIDDATATAAQSETIVARTHAPLFAVEAPYIAEMARLELRQRFGANAESAGYKVYTTIDGRLQAYANRALRIGLIEYDRRHGFRGPVGHVQLATNSNTEQQLEELVEEYATVGNLLQPAVVVSVAPKTVRVYAKTRGFAQIDWDGMVWARKPGSNETVGPAPKSADEIVSRGDVVYV